MARFTTLKRSCGILALALMLALGLSAPQAASAAQPGSILSPNQPGNNPPCLYVQSCPHYPAITNVLVQPSYFSVAITFDMDMSGDPLWGKAKVEVLKNGQVVKSGTQFAAPSGLRHMAFQFNNLDSLTQYQFKIYREVGADSYMPHLYQTGNFQTLMCDY